MNSLVLLFVLFTFEGILAQNLNVPIRKEFSFGKYWSYTRIDKNASLDDINQKFTLDGIVYEDTIFFQRKGTFNQNSFQLLLTNKNVRTIILIDSNIDAFVIPPEGLSKNVELMNCKFNLGFSAMIDKPEIKNMIFISGGEMNNSILLIDTKFKKNLSLWGLKIKTQSSINASIFEGKVDFMGDKFESTFSIDQCSFKNIFLLRFTSFEKGFSISDTKFNSTVRFNGIQVARRPEFSRVSFSDSLILNECNFQEGLDLRRCNLNSTNAIYFENMSYPDGKFLVNWDQIKSIDSPRIRLINQSKDNEDNYNRLVLIYEKLRDNYLAQGRKVDADNVMYELAEYKNQLIGGMGHTLYGFFLGYGYQPWRFVLFWVFPIIIIFSFIWYVWFYGIIIKIVSPNMDSAIGLTSAYSIKTPTKDVKLFNRILIKIYDHKKISPPINIIARLWHVIFFSASVLLSIRFKKEWITDHSKKEILGIKSYMSFVTIEWLLGIFSYIVFVVLVLGNQFGYVKGLLGF